MYVFLCVCTLLGSRLYLRLPAPQGSRVYALSRVPTRLWSRTRTFLHVLGQLASSMPAFFPVPVQLGSRIRDFYMCRQTCGEGCLHFYVGEQGVCIFAVAGAPEEHNVHFCVCRRVWRLGRMHFHMCRQASRAECIYFYVCRRGFAAGFVHFYVCWHTLGAGCMHFYLCPRT